MIVPIRIKYQIDGLEDVAEFDWDVEANKCVAFLVNGIDFRNSDFYYAIIRIFGGEDNILFKHLDNAIAAAKEDREERRAGA